MWYLQADLYHVIHSNFAMPCDTFKLFIPCDTFKLLYKMWYFLIVYTMRYLQQTFCLYHVILSICVIPCDAFKLCYAMWYLKSVWYHVIPPNCLYNMKHSTVLYPVIPLIWFMSCDTFKMFIPYDTFKLFYAMWYL